MMTMDVGMYDNGQSYPGECWSGAGYHQPPAPCEGYHEGYYETNTHYYEPAPAPPVISADGLCYTNLDYGELGYPPGYEARDQAPPMYDAKFVPYGEEVPAQFGAEYEQYVHKEEFPREQDCPRMPSAGPSLPHAVPTYKWMQVKRNVPKPNSKFFIIN